MRTAARALAALVLLAAAAAPVRAAEEPVLNLYSARHYQTDEALYDNFTKATGIRINRIEAGDEQLVERLKNEGAASPADVFNCVRGTICWTGSLRAASSCSGASTRGRSIRRRALPATRCMPLVPPR